jgi:hypothetical protein
MRARRARTSGRSNARAKSASIEGVSDSPRGRNDRLQRAYTTLGASENAAPASPARRMIWISIDVGSSPNRSELITTTYRRARHRAANERWRRAMSPRIGTRSHASKIARADRRAPGSAAPSTGDE